MNLKKEFINTGNKIPIFKKESDPLKTQIRTPSLEGLNGQLF